MPLYTYRCQKCNHLFEMLVRSTDVPLCPSCGGADLERQISSIAAEGKLAGVIKEGRAQAAREGHFSNYSKSELPRR